MKPTKFYLAFTFLLIFALMLLLASWAKGPDFEMSFRREVESPLKSSVLDQDIRVLSNWPKWFYSLKDAKVLDFMGRPYPLKEQFLSRGSLIHLWIEPKEKEWKRFDLFVSVVSYIPEKSIEVRVVKDSTGRLSRVFDEITWKIELMSHSTGTLIIGTASAHTSSWRSRVTGHIAEKVVMNQIFYPNLQALAQLDHPLEPNPYQQTER